MNRTESIKEGLKMLRRFFILNDLLGFLVYTGLFLCGGLLILIGILWIFSTKPPVEIFLVILFAPLVSAFVLFFKKRKLEHLALLIDRRFGLDERLSTAIQHMEGKIPMTLLSDRQIEDARDIFFKLDVSKLKRIKPPKCAILLPISLLLLMLFFHTSRVVVFAEREPSIKDILSVQLKEIKKLMGKMKLYLPDPIKRGLKDLECRLEKDVLLDKQGSIELVGRLLTVKDRIMQMLSNEFCQKLIEKNVFEVFKKFFESVDLAGEAIAQFEGISPLYLKKDWQAVDLQAGFPSKGDKGSLKAGSDSEKFDPEGFMEKNVEKFTGYIEPRIKRSIIEVFLRHRWHPKYDKVIKRYFSWK
jgi:hypothetical protein